MQNTSTLTLCNLLLYPYSAKCQTTSWLPPQWLRPPCLTCEPPWSAAAAGWQRGWWRQHPDTWGAAPSPGHQGTSSSHSPVAEDPNATPRGVTMKVAWSCCHFRTPAQPPPCLVFDKVHSYIHSEAHKCHHSKGRWAPSCCSSSGHSHLKCITEEYLKCV